MKKKNYSNICEFRTELGKYDKSHLITFQKIISHMDIQVGIKFLRQLHRTRHQTIVE